MKPIFNPATEYSTVQQCLLTSVDATKKLNQQYTFVTFDLAMAKIAYNIIWNSPETFGGVVVNLGGFHTMCAYMAALGRMMTGSGFEELLIEARLCAGGSVMQVMNGKHFNRAVKVHHHMLDAINRLTLDAFLDSSDCAVARCDEMKALAENPSSETLCSLLRVEGLDDFLKSLNSFWNRIRDGEMGKIAQFWTLYTDCVLILLRFLRSMKENNLPEYIRSLRHLCPLMFSSDRQNYARYLTLHYTQMSTLAQSHPGAEVLLRDFAISVARSQIPACQVPLDMTIEPTLNRSAKTAGGLVGFTRNTGAYQRWCLTRHERAAFLAAVSEQTDINTDSSNSHKSCTTADMQTSKAEVKRLKAAFDSFCNPFKPSQTSADSLYCISSGYSVSAEVEHDLLTYVKSGETATQSFIADRIASKQKKLKLKNFEHMSVKKTLTSSKQKTVRVTAERNILGHLLTAGKGQDVDFYKLFAYPLNPVPWSLVKTDKAQLLHAMEAGTDTYHKSPHELPFNCAVVVDGNAMLQSMSRLPDTFGEFALCALKCLPKAQTVHFVTDS